MTHSIYTNSLAVAGLLLLVTAVSALMRGSHRGNRSLLLLLTAAMTYCLGYAGELIYDSPSTTHFFGHFQYIGVVACAPSWLMVCLAHVGVNTPGWRKGVRFAWSLALVALLVRWTTESHHLFYSTVKIAPVGPHMAIRMTYGPLYWLMVFCLHWCFLGGMLVLWRRRALFLPLHHTQLGLMLGSMVVPMAANLLYALRLPPEPELDKAPYAMAVTGLLASVAILRYDVANMAPALRSDLLERVPQGILIFSRRKRLVSFNQAAYDFFDAGMLRVGAMLESFPGFLRDLAKEHGSSGECWREVGLDGENQWAEVSLTQVHSPGKAKPVGTAFVLQDITRTRRIQESLQNIIDDRRSKLDDVIHQASQAREDERQAIGRNLHDTLCQEFASVVALLEPFESANNEDRPIHEPRTVEQFTSLAKQARQVYQRARDFAHSLDSEAVSHESFEDELEAFCESTARIHAVECELVLEERFVLPEDGHADAALKIIREGVFNALRHGRAKRVWVDLVVKREGERSISVCNDGLPIPPVEKRTKGLGLMHIQQRAEEMGGSCTIESRDDGITVLQVLLPGPTGEA